MQHKEKRKRSKLKLRPYGVITIQTGEPDYEQHSHTAALRQTGDRASGNAIVHNRTSTLLSLLKGSTVFLLIALTLSWKMALSWSADQPFRISFQDDTIQASSESKRRPVDTKSQREISNMQLNPATPVEIADNNPTAPKLEQNKTAAVQSSKTQTIVPAGSNSTSPISVEVVRQATQGTNPSVTDTRLDVFEPVAVENTPINTNAGFIKAYKASVFSSLSAGAIETPVSHGAAVYVLDRIGDWVEVEVPIDNITGFIHITHLNIQ